MKKTLALLLALLMLATVFTGCGDDGKGAVIPVYICDEVVNFDPAYAYDNESSLKILPLLYEGLTTVNKKGKVEKALMDKYTYKQQEDGTWMMEVTLKESYWSDGITVSADDFVFAFKRLLQPETDSPAAALLYDLKNARKVKAGDASIDDLGVRSAEKTVLQFFFERDIDEDAWLETLASPALVPLRESAVSSQTPTDEVIKTDENGLDERVAFQVPVYAWSTDSAILVTNGKFTVKKIKVATEDEDGELLLERNMYYRRDPKGDEKETKYVKTYQLKMVFPSEGRAEAYEAEAGEQLVNLNQLIAYADFEADTKSESIAFDSDISMVDVEKAETVDMLAQHVYYFNTNNDLFKDAEVRRALSMAIDREAITDIVSYTAASEGLVVEGVYADSKRKTTYREEYGSLIDSSADMDEAKALLSGKSKGSFKITCRDTEVDVAIAEYVASVWNELGYKVTVKKLGYDNKGISGTDQVNKYHLYRDQLTDAYLDGDFDVIATDYVAMSTYAFASLSPFATGFSGRIVDQRQKNDPDVSYTPDLRHITGWQNDKYDELLEDAFEETDLADRSAILFEAEEILMEEMPVMPLVRYQNAYVVNKDLKKLENTYYGSILFDQAKLKHAEDYVVEEE